MKFKLVSQQFNLYDFFEQIPDLHIIAAGSLLEFAIAEIPSYGVGKNKVNVYVSTIVPRILSGIW